eukprot:gene2402-8192_t
MFGIVLGMAVATGGALGISAYAFAAGHVQLSNRSSRLFGIGSDDEGEGDLETRVAVLEEFLTSRQLGGSTAPC